MFCKILNNRLVQCLDKGGVLHEGQAGFRINRSCMDNVYTLNEIVQGRLREDKKTCIIFRYSGSLYMIPCGMMVCSINCGTWV